MFNKIDPVLILKTWPERVYRLKICSSAGCMPDLSWFALCSRHICSNTCHVMPSPMFTYQPLANIRESQHWGRREGVYTREKWNKFSGWEGVTWKILSFMPSLAPFGEYCKVSEHNCKFTYYLHSPIGSLSIHFSAWILSVFIHVDWVVIFLQFFAFFPLNFSV